MPFITGRQILGAVPSDLWRRGVKFWKYSQYLRTLFTYDSYKAMMNEYGAKYLLVNKENILPGQNYNNVFDIINQTNSMLLLKLKP